MPKKVVIAGNAAVKHINTGSATAGLTPVQLTASTRNLTSGVHVVADTANTNSVWVGVRSNLTAGTGDTSGVELPAGTELMVPVTKESDLYIVSDAAAQVVTFMSH